MFGAFPEDRSKIRGQAVLVTPQQQSQNGVCSFGESLRTQTTPFTAIVKHSALCTFVDQVRTLQRIGAVAVIGVVSKADCRNDMEERCKAKFDTMIRGSGMFSDDILIPVLVSFPDEVAEIMNFIGTSYKRNNYGQIIQRQLRIEIDFDPRDPNHEEEEAKDNVNYEFWSQPGDVEGAYEFITKFFPVAKALGPNVSFTPYFGMFDEEMRSHCQAPHTDENKWCEDFCLFEGSYCAYHQGYSPGVRVVLEILRQNCIWSLYGGDGLGEQWWKYNKAYMEACTNKDNIGNTSCIKEAFDFAGIDGDKVALCMEYTSVSDYQNSMLDKEVAAGDSRNVWSFPSSFVNDFMVEDGANPEFVFLAICSEFPDRHKPKLCKECSSCPKALECAHAGGKCPSQESPLPNAVPSKHQRSGLSLGDVLIVILLSLTSGLLASQIDLKHFLARRRNAEQSSTLKED